MKNAYLPLLVLFLTPFSMMGQSCLPGGITFDHQWQVDEFPANFPGCRHILGSVIINDSAAIHHLDSLFTVDSISGDLQLLHNSLIPNFQGLNQLKYLGGDLNIHNSTGLESYSGLENLVEIGGDFNFDFSNPVTSFANFTSLKKIGGTLTLFSNTKNSLDFPVLSRINGNLHVSYGGYLDPYGGDYIIFTGPDSLHFIGGDVRFGNSDPGADPPFFMCKDINHILGFQHLDTIGGNLSFSHCSHLLDASGFSSLKYIGKNVFFYLTWDLTMNFLSKVNYIGGSFISFGSGRDTTFTFLNNLQYLGKDFVLSEHSRTRDLNSLQSFKQMNGSLSISFCSKLSSLQDLKNIKTIEGSLRIQGNKLIESLGGLEDLEYIGDSLLILNHHSLTSLQYLGSNLTIGKYVEIRQNNINICGVDPICNYLEDPLAPAFIGNNLTGCNSRQEVEEACGIVSLQSSIPAQWRISPNPSDGLYLIDFPMPNSDFLITVFDLQGRQLHHQPSVKGNYLDIRALPSGTYMVRIQNNKTTLNQLIQKI